MCRCLPAESSMFDDFRPVTFSVIGQYFMCGDCDEQQSSSYGLRNSESVSSLQPKPNLQGLSNYIPPCPTYCRISFRLRA